MKNSKRTLTSMVALLIVITFISCTSPTAEDPGELELAPLSQNPGAEFTTPSCSTRNYRAWLISTQQWDLDGFTSPVVCPPSDGGDGYLRITTYGELIESSDGFYFEVEKWDDTSSSWDTYWTHDSPDIFARGDDIYVFESDAYGNAFNGMDGDERFRLRVYEVLLIGTGGGGGTGVDSIRVVFDLND
ncbi:MAG: hypothetical protein ED557_15310 [Balneola sp.]|nr:MAG: hypothetical protein ED557_15310 [Balneola sp.]